MTTTGQSLQAAENILGTLFSKDYDFVIPDYQRPYAWGPEQALQLLDDLRGAMETETNEPYFLGSIVLVKSPSEPRVEVIDGQQRLTTLTLIFALARDLVDDADLREEIHQFIEEPPVRYLDRPALPHVTLRRRDNAFFRQYVQRRGATPELVALTPNSCETEAQHCLRDNARALRKELVGWSQDELLQLYKLMGSRTYLVTVTTPDLTSAYRIFSVMNSRGLPLLPSDIFKSQIIGAVPESEQSDYADRWERLEEGLGRSEFADLFLYIRAIKSQTRAVRTLLQEFPEQVMNHYLPGNGKGFITEVLEPYARADMRLLEQNFEGAGRWPQVNAWLKRLAQLDNDDWRPPVLWALNEHGDDDVFLDAFLAKVERLAASMFIRRVHRSHRTNRYMELLRQLVNGDGLDASAFVLSDAEKAQTCERLDDELYLSTRVRKYVLLRLDSLLANDPGATYDHHVISVEHVLPQQPAANSQWRRDFSDEEAAYWTHRLGNLLLLSRRKNAEAQNHDFARKKSTYFASAKGVAVFALTTQVLAEEQWTPAVVKARHERLLSMLIHEWDLD